MQKFVKDNSYGPYIHTVSVGMEFGLFGSDVLLRTGNCLHDNILRAQTEVGYFNIRNGQSLPILAGEQNVLWFEVPMSNTMVMEFLHSFAYLKDAFESVHFREPMVFGFVERIPTVNPRLTIKNHQHNTL